MNYNKKKFSDNYQPSKTEIKILKQWQFMRQNITKIRCCDCPFEECCQTFDMSTKVNTITLCQHIDNFINIIIKKWNLSKENK